MIILLLAGEIRNSLVYFGVMDLVSYSDNLSDVTPAELWYMCYSRLRKNHIEVGMFLIDV